MYYEIIDKNIKISFETRLPLIGKIRKIIRHPSGQFAVLTDRVTMPITILSIRFVEEERDESIYYEL